jgi:putative IMPACT (imprinted ancient) family translation regulator
VDYSIGATLENYFRRDDIIIEEIDYSEKETIKVLLPEEKIDRVKADLSNMLMTDELPPILDRIAFCESNGKVTIL